MKKTAVLAESFDKDFVLLITIVMDSSVPFSTEDPLEPARRAIETGSG